MIAVGSRIAAVLPRRHRFYARSHRAHVLLQFASQVLVTAFSPRKPPLYMHPSAAPSEKDYMNDTDHMSDRPLVECRISTHSRMHKPMIATSSSFPAAVWMPWDPFKCHWLGGPRIPSTTVGASNTAMNRSMPMSVPGWIGFLVANSLTMLAIAQRKDNEHCRIA